MASSLARRWFSNHGGPGSKDFKGSELKEVASMCYSSKDFRLEEEARKAREERERKRRQEQAKKADKGRAADKEKELVRA